MAKSCFAVVLCLAVSGQIGRYAIAAPAAGEGGDDASLNFMRFSSNLLMESDLDEFSIEKGAAISSPFGVGYMLANIHAQVWNISNDGFGQVLKSPQNDIPAQYASLIEKLNKANMQTNSVLYVRDRNSLRSDPITLPEGSQKLKTEMTYADFISDWKTSWFAMNDMITNHTAGKLNDQLVPKGGWWGGAFYPFTTSAYINTYHYKTNWEKKWTPIGEKKFWDGYSVPFYQVEGTYPLTETENYTAIAIQLQDKGKFAVFVLPKGKLVQFIRGDLANLMKNVDPTAWKVSSENKKLQVPALNITLLDQHYKKLETLGINHTFCLPEAAEDPVTGSATGPSTTAIASKNQRGSYFSSPIVQAHHIQLAEDFIEVATATGASVNSEEKLKEDRDGDIPPDYDYGIVPPSENGPVDAPLAALAGLAGGDDDTAEVVVPVVLDDGLAKALENGKMDVKGVDLTIEDPKTNETFKAQGSLSDSPPTSDAMFQARSGDAMTSADSSTDAVSTIKVEAVAELPTSTEAPEPLDKDTIRFSQPFFWYLYDKELGPLYYGTIHSLATYRKEYGLETDEDLWLFDAYKTLLWNCP